MTEDTSELQFSSRELQLVLKYDYPFAEEAELLRNSPVKNGLHVINIDPYWVPMGALTLCDRPRKSTARACSMNSTRCAMY
jgi:hypothetical protein